MSTERGGSSGGTVGRGGAGWGARVETGGSARGTDVETRFCGSLLVGLGGSETGEGWALGWVGLGSCEG